MLLVRPLQLHPSTPAFRRHPAAPGGRPRGAPAAGRQLRLAPARRLRAVAARALISPQDIDPYNPASGDSQGILYYKRQACEARELVRQQLAQAPAGVPLFLDDVEVGSLEEGLAQLRRNQRMLADCYRVEQDPEYAARLREAEQEAEYLRVFVSKATRPGVALAMTAGTSLALAAPVVGAAYLLGFPAANQLVLPPDATPAGLAAMFALYTVPYTAATLAASAAMPPEQAVRAQNLRLPPLVLRRLSLLTLAGIAAGMSFSECLEYQGLWQGAAFRALGLTPSGNTLPSVGELLQPLSDSAADTAARMAALQLPFWGMALLAAAGVGALHAAWSAIPLELRMGIDWSKQGFPNVSFDVTLGMMPAWTVLARAGLGSAYLSAETALTGSLWLAVATSTVGLLGGLLLAQGRLPPENEYEAAVLRGDPGAGGPEAGRK